MTQEGEILRLRTPIPREISGKLTAGTEVRLDGVIYAMRDIAHAKMIEVLRAGESLPFELEGAVILYASPTPTKPGRLIGSIGPTTSGRMDPFTPELLRAGVTATIGKGVRNIEVCSAMAENSAVYFAVTGGVAALLSQSVTACRIAAFAELGSDAVLELGIRDFPAVVAQDSHGGNIFVKKIDNNNKGGKR